MTNHNVETYKIKRKEDLVFAVFKVTIQQIKVKGMLSISVIFVVTLDIRSWIVLIIMIYMSN
jgi:hypothetical protein